MKKGFTLVEALVCLAIVLTLIGLLVPAIQQSLNNNPTENGEKSIPDGWIYGFVTVKHDNHLFIKLTQAGIIHHPDCPCFTQTAEKEEKQ